jgi:hypothetical protein
MLLLHSDGSLASADSSVAARLKEGATPSVARSNIRCSRTLRERMELVSGSTVPAIGVSLSGNVSRPVREIIRSNSFVERRGSVQT